MKSKIVFSGLNLIFGSMLSLFCIAVSAQTYITNVTVADVEKHKLIPNLTVPIAEIGFVFAYNDQTTFAKFFKSMANITPLQYRKNFLSKSLEMPSV